MYSINLSNVGALIQHVVLHRVQLLSVPMSKTRFSPKLFNLKLSYTVQVLVYMLLCHCVNIPQNLSTR